MALTFVQQLLAAIDEEAFSLEHMIVHRDNFENENDPLNEFDQYVSLITEIKKSSEKSKLSVETILQDSDKLKFANTRLNDYGDFMKRLERLTSAVDELEYKIAVKEFDFRTIDNILDIIDNEVSETQTFHGTCEFIALQERITSTKSALRKEIFKRYREIGIWSEIPVTAYGKQIDSNSRASVVVESLRNANLIVDTLGEDTVNDLIETLIQTQILSYQIRAGYEGGDIYGLEKEMLEKRWEELYRLLGSSSAPHMQRIMSPEWDITFKLYVEFCRRTAQHIEKLLDQEVKKLYPPPPQPVTQTSSSSSAASSLAAAASLASNLLPPPSPSLASFRSSTSLNDTNDTTSEHQSPTIPPSVVANTSTNNNTSGDVDPNLLQEHGNFVVQILKSVLATEQEVHKMFDDGVFALSVTGYVSAPSNIQQPSNRCYLMSSLFDKYLDPFVQSERRNVQELIQSLVAEDIRLITPEPLPDQLNQNQSTPSKSNNNNGNNNNNNNQQSPTAPQSTKEEVVDMIAYNSSCQRIFNSAEMIFQTIRSSLLRCASFSSGLPLLTLAHEYKVCFQIYAETLRNCLCPSIPSTAPRVGKRQAFNLSLDEEILACRSIITAEKCSSLIPIIQNEITSKLQSQYASDIDMRAQSELFEDVTYHGVNILVGSLLGKANECLVYMVATPWSKITVVGDCSPYIRKLHTMLNTVIPRLRKVLSWKCFEALCHRFSSDLLDYFLALIMGLKKISVVGAEQLLLDTNELKPLLMKLHHIALPQKSLERQTMQVSEKYYEIVTKKSRLIEVVLKLICSDDEQIEETFYIMWPEGQEADLRIIKALKASTHAPSNSGGNGSISGSTHNNHYHHHHDDGISSHDTSLPTSSGGSGFGSVMLGSLGSLDNAVGNLRAKATNLSDRFKLGKK